MRNIAKVLRRYVSGRFGSDSEWVCIGRGRRPKTIMVAATVNGRNIMLQEVERAVNQQAGGNTSQFESTSIGPGALAGARAV